MRMITIVRFVAFTILCQSTFFLWSQPSSFFKDESNFGIENIETAIDSSFILMDKLRSTIRQVENIEGYNKSTQFGLRHIPNEDEDVYITYTVKLATVLKNIEFGWSVSNVRCASLKIVKTISLDKSKRKK